MTTQTHDQDAALAERVGDAKPLLYVRPQPSAFFWNGYYLCPPDTLNAIPVYASPPAAPQQTADDDFTKGINAAAAMLDRKADTFANDNAKQDADTGALELGSTGEDYYNNLSELADEVRSLVLGNVAPAAPRPVCRMLTEAAQAVINRWDSPNWDWEKDGPTAGLIAALRKAIAAQEGV